MPNITTKRFLLATSAVTVDGRKITPQEIDTIAKRFNSKTYGARINIEHIRGLGPDNPFRAYGDVVDVSADDLVLESGGKSEKVRGLYGVLSVSSDAKQLNDAGLKVYPSIEIEPNFEFAGETGPYLVGLALTDSPACKGTDRLVFNTSRPSSVMFSALDCGIAGAVLEFEPAAPATAAAVEEVKGFFSQLKETIASFAKPADPAPAPEPKPDTPPALDLAKFTTDLGTTLEKAFATQASAIDAKFSALEARFAALEATVEKTPDPTHTPRPLANGTDGDKFRAQF